MATLFDKNGIKILKGDVRAVEKALTSHIDSRAINALDEQLKAALKEAAEKRKAAEKAAKAAKIAAAKIKAAEEAAKNVANAAKLLRFVRGDITSFTNESMGEIEETLSNPSKEFMNGRLSEFFSKEDFKHKMFKVLQTYGHMFEEEYDHKFNNEAAVLMLASKDPYWYGSWSDKLGDFIIGNIPDKISMTLRKAPNFSALENVGEIIFNGNKDALLKWRREEFSKNSFEDIWVTYAAARKIQIAQHYREQGRFSAAAMAGVARPDLARWQNIDPKAWLYIDRKAAELGLEPEKVYDSHGVWGINPNGVSKAWYASGCKLGGKFRIFVMESLHAIVREGRVDFSGPATPEKRENVKSYKGRIMLIKDLDRLKTFGAVGAAVSPYNFPLSDFGRYNKLSPITRYYILYKDVFIIEGGSRVGIDWVKVAEWLKLPKRRKATDLPFSLAWELLFNRKAPKGLTDEDPNPTNFDKVSQKTFRSLMATVKDQSSGYGLAANTKAAYHLALGFRDIQSVKRWVAVVRGGDINSAISIHDSYVNANNLLATTNRVAWTAFLTQFPEERWHIGYFTSFERKFGRVPSGKREFVEFVSLQHYQNVEDETVAAIAAKLKVGQDDFKDYQEFFKNHPEKTATMLPSIEVSKNNYVFRKLDDHDKVGPFLGLLTDCCQHLHNAGSSCAEAGWRDSESGFYIVEKDGDVVAQSWAWRGKQGELCFDSIEGLGNINTNVVASLYHRAATELLGKLGISKVTVGNTSYGITKKVKKYLVEKAVISGGKIDNPAKMVRKVKYTDAKTQWLLAE